MCAHSESRQQTQQHDDGKRRDKRRQPPIPQRIVILIPSHSRTSCTPAIAKFWRAPISRSPFERLGCLAGPHLSSRNHAFRSLRYFLTAFLSSNNCFPACPLVCNIASGRI